jgi:hypothetical protein
MEPLLEQRLHRDTNVEGEEVRELTPRPEPLNALPTNVGTNSYTTSRDSAWRAATSKNAGLAGASWRVSDGISWRVTDGSRTRDRRDHNRTDEGLGGDRTHVVAGRTARAAWGAPTGRLKRHW